LTQYEEHEKKKATDGGKLVKKEENIREKRKRLLT
jgi:hypothetical protein